MYKLWSISQANEKMSGCRLLIGICTSTLQILQWLNCTKIQASYVWINRLFVIRYWISLNDADIEIYFSTNQFVIAVMTQAKASDIPKCTSGTRKNVQYLIKPPYKMQEPLFLAFEI